MRVGISLSSSYRVDDVREGARWMTERARAASEAGLDTLFVGDHHVTPAPYYQNVPMLGRLLAEWDDERPAGALFLLPLWHPVLVAEQVGTLASIARGRFILQCAVGADERQSLGMGVSQRERPSRFEESLDVIRRLCAGEEVTGGRRWRYERARISPRPPEPLEVWIGGSVDATIDRAARLGDGFLADPGLTRAAAREHAAKYLDRAAAHGRSPTAVAIRRDVYVGENDEEAEATVGPILDRGYRGFDPDAVVYGGVERVAERFEELAGAGYTDVIIRSMVPDQAKALASLDRMRSVREAVLPL